MTIATSPDARPSQVHSLAEVAAVVQGRLLREEDGAVCVTSVRGLSTAVSGCLSYVETEKVLGLAEASPCAALLVPKGVTPSLPAIEVGNPRVAFARALCLFHPEVRPSAGVHETACVSPSARVAASAVVGPLAFVGDETFIGEGAVVEAACRIGRRCVIGAGARLRPHVVLGDDVEVGQRVILHPRGTFGMFCGPDSASGCEQREGIARGGATHDLASGSEGAGGVTAQVLGGTADVACCGQEVRAVLLIGDDVEAGARVVIAGARGIATQVGAGTKIDNLVHVGAGAQVGRHCILVGHASVEPGVVLGDYSVMAGQCVATQGVVTGPQAVVGSRSVVVGDLPAKCMVSGDPARPHRDELRREHAMQKLPESVRRLEALEASLGRTVQSGG